MRRTLLLSCLAGLLFAGGCGGYYRVTDPSTGKVYYTQDVSRREGAALRFRDAATGDEMTLQNSQIGTISKEEFDSNLHKKPTTGM